MALRNDSEEYIKLIQFIEKTSKHPDFIKFSELNDIIMSKSMRWNIKNIEKFHDLCKFNSFDYIHNLKRELVNLTNNVLKSEEKTNFIIKNGSDNLQLSEEQIKTLQNQGVIFPQNIKMSATGATGPISLNTTSNNGIVGYTDFAKLPSSPTKTDYSANGYDDGEDDDDSDEEYVKKVTGFYMPCENEIIDENKNYLHAYCFNRLDENDNDTYSDWITHIGKFNDLLISRETLQASAEKLEALFPSQNGVYPMHIFYVLDDNNKPIRIIDDAEVKCDVGFNGKKIINSLTNVFDIDTNPNVISFKF